MDEVVELIDSNEETVFENEEVNTEDLVERADEEFDFNDYGNRKKATKPKPISKEQRKKRNKMVKASRRKNRR